MKKTCGNCVNCEKYTSNGKENWACENAYNQVGWPVNVFPPYDEACENWTDKPEEKGKAEREMRDFIDHFWDEED